MTEENHKLSAGHMRLARKLGRGFAERAVVLQPLPWSGDDLAAAIALADRSFREVLPDAEPRVVHALGIQAANFMIERLNELSAAAAGRPEGGAA